MLKNLSPWNFLAILYQLSGLSTVAMVLPFHLYLWKTKHLAIPDQNAELSTTTTFSPCSYITYKILYNK